MCCGDGEVLLFCGEKVCFDGLCGGVVIFVICEVGIFMICCKELLVCVVLGEVGRSVVVVICLRSFWCICV